jgi:hypothetical protein
MNPRTTDLPEITLISPDGKIVRTSEYFECPAEIIIGHNGVSFDGWVFRTNVGFFASDMRWLGNQIATIQDTQGAERAEAVLAAFERLLITPKGAASCHSLNRLTSI